VIDCYTGSVIRASALITQIRYLTFTSIEALRWTLVVRNILRDPRSSGNQSKYVPPGGSFMQACQVGELDIVNAMLEGTQVELEAECVWHDSTALGSRQWSPPCGAVPVQAGS